MRHLSILRPYLARHRVALIVGALLIIGKTVAFLQIPGLTRVAIDAINADAGMGPIYRVVFWILIFGLIFWVLTFGMRMVIVGASRKVEYGLRNDFFAKLMSLSPSYYDRQHTGDLVTRTNSDLSQVRELLGPGLMYPLEVSALVAIAVPQMIAIDAKLTLLATLPLVLVLIATQRWTGRLRVLYTTVQERLSTVTSLVEENLSGIRVVKAYTREANEIARFKVVGEEYMRHNLILARLQGVLFPTLLLVAQLGGVVVLAVGGMAVIHHLEGRGGITLGQFAEFIMLLGMLTFPMMALGWVINVWQRGFASLARVAQVLGEEPMIFAPDDPQPLDSLRGEIEARGLTFTYPGTDRPVMQDVNFRIPAGHTVALVGHTGSGKSTLAHLLLRLYPVERGMLFVDGVDVNDHDPRVLRRAIGFVSQEPFLFAESIADNICFGLDRTDPDLARTLAQQVDLDTDVAGFPQGLATVIGERGVTLSGGQRQRTALARALAVDPSVLILDDALSAVDTHTEEIVLGRLRGEMRARTTLLIAHRVSTVMLADHILVLREGEIVEQGSHAELLAMEREYAALYRQQLLTEALEQES